MKKRWLSVEGIAAHPGVNPDTIYKWIARKKMPAHKIYRLEKFIGSKLDAGIKAGKAAEDSSLTARSGVNKALS